MSYTIRLFSDYSFNKSTIRIDDILSYCKSNNLNRCFLCDTNLHGSLEFYYKCKENNIKPIIGLTLKVKYNDEFNYLTLIAKNANGHKNLSRLSTMSYSYKQDYVEYKNLFMYAQDLILLINNDDSYIASMLNENKVFEANEYLEPLRSSFKDIYFGVYRYHGINLSNLNSFIDYGKHNNIEIVASPKATHKSDKDTLILNLIDCISKNIPANKDFLANEEICDAYLKTFNQLKLSYEKDELENVNKLANKINLELTKVSYSLPVLCDNPNEKLKELATASLINKKLDGIKEYQDRLAYELDVIFKMGFSNYYLLVADYVNYAKNNDIPVGLRGSGAASLVAYLINIANVDPLKYDLLFERFLNVNRSNYPDFDMDFADIKREDIIKYVKEKYGNRNVAQIATYNSYGAKGAIRDVARIMGKSNEVISEITKAFKDNENSINEEYNENPKFKSLLDIHSDYKLICSLASNLENLKKQVGLHAAGILMSNEPIDSLVPCFLNGDGQFAIQYDHDYAEKVGLIKMDFLGLKNLTIVDYCLKEINKKHNKNYTIDTYPFDDINGYNLIAKGETRGIFQLDTSESTKKIAIASKPSSFEDIVALLALIRPGSAMLANEYIERKNGQSINYVNDDIRKIVEPTYGILLYQEQVMQLCQVVANYTLAEADIFRRAISKKKKDVMDKEKDNFIKKSVANGYSIDLANKLFNLIAKFAEYGFNKGHSVSYGRLTSLMATIKANYKTIFYESLLNVNKEKEEGRKAIFNEARKYNIFINKPDVTKSAIHFTSTSDSINFGLADINDISEFIANTIINEREACQFNDIYDFAIRMVRNDVSMQVLLNLTYAGALDCFNVEKEKVIANIQGLYDFASMFKSYDYKPNSYSNYKDIQVPLMYFSDKDTDFNKKEYEMLGYYLTTHPITKIKHSLNTMITNLDEIIDDGTYKVVIKVISKELRKGKDDKEYLTLKVEDETGFISIRDYRNANDIYNKVKKNDVLLLNIACKNSYYYLNSMEEIK